MFACVRRPVTYSTSAILAHIITIDPVIKLLGSRNFSVEKINNELSYFGLFDTLTNNLEMNFEKKKKKLPIKLSIFNCELMNSVTKQHPANSDASKACELPIKSIGAFTLSKSLALIGLYVFEEAKT